MNPRSNQFSEWLARWNRDHPEASATTSYSSRAVTEIAETAFEDGYKRAVGDLTLLMDGPIGRQLTQKLRDERKGAEQPPTPEQMESGK